MTRQVQRFQVALKALIVRDDRLLVVRESDGPRYWELPGGRIDVGEEELPLAQVLQRELREELGLEFRCTIGAPALNWTRRIATGDWAFLVGYECNDIAGEIRLSDEHGELRWVDRDAWRELTFAPGYRVALETFWSRFQPKESP